jgi:WD40 repeat protein
VDASGRRLPFFRGVAQTGRQVAQGLAYAHARGVVHRDIKPSNLLLDTAGVVWITDFGLAKTEDEGLTQTGEVVGTLRYMAPERFRGEADARSDLYALGLTLYELLTLRQAHDSRDRLELIQQVKTNEPPRPRSIDGRIPLDLETIVLKAIDKDPARRYASAEAMAEDLRRYLDDEPILARRVGQGELVWRWARRHKAIAALLATLAAVLTLGCVVMTVLWSRAEINAAAAKSLASREQAARGEAQALATREAAASGAARALAIKEANARAEADRKAEQLSLEDYINRVNRAYREIQDDNVALAEDLLHGCPPERRGWEWHLVERLCNSERRVIDLGNATVSSLAYGPDGTFLVVGLGGQFGGSQAESSVEVWDPESGQRRHALPGARGNVYDVAVSPDGKNVAAGFENGIVMVWDLATAQAAWTQTVPGFNAMSVAFSPDGQSLAVGYGFYSGTQVGRVKVWSTRSGDELRQFPAPRGGANKIAFHPDGKRLAVAGLDVVEVWDLGTTSKCLDLKGHKKWAYCAAFSPDGKWLATGGWDRTIKLRDARTGALAFTVFPHEGFVLNLAFSADSTNLVTTSEDRSVRLWEVPSGRNLATFHGHTDFVWGVAFRGDGREVATGSVDGTIRLWDLRTSRPVVVDHTGWVQRLAFRRDGLRVLSETGLHGTDPVPTKGWNPLTGELDPALAGLNFEALPEDFAIGDAWPLGSQQKRSVKSPDGKLVAVTADLAGAGGAARSREYSLSAVIVRDAESGQIRHTLTGHSADVVAMVFSPDSRRLATASWDRTIKLWDVQSGQAVFTLLGHTAGVLSLAFSPDGHELVSGGIDFTARVWNATPLESHVTAGHDARYRKKVETLARLKAATDELSRAEILADSGQSGMAAEALARARARLEQQLVAEPDNAGVANVLAELLLIDSREDWTVLKPAAMSSRGGAELNSLKDGSVLASGPNPRNDTYYIVAPVDSGAIAGLLVEAIPDPSLPAGGAGRGPGGTMAVSGVSLALEVPGRDGAVSAAFERAWSDIDSDAAPNTIDGRSDTSFRIPSDLTKRHRLVLGLSEPLAVPENGRVRIGLEFLDATHPTHGLGRFRLSVTGDRTALDRSRRVSRHSG